MLRNFLDRIHPLSEAEHLAIEAHLRPKASRKGEIILAEGQVQRDVLFILEGAQMSHYQRNGKQFVTAFSYAPGVAAVPDSFLYQRPSIHTFECLSDSSFLALSFEAREALMAAHPGISTLFRRFAEMIVVGLLERQAELQSHTMEERYRTFCKRSPHLLHLVPHKYLASYLGIDPTNFSKLYNSVRI